MVETVSPDDPFGVTDTLADAFRVEAATLVAVTVTLVVAFTEGAVNSPELETLPALAVQLTPVCDVPLTIAENCWEAPEATVALVGEIVILIDPPEPPTFNLNLRSPRSERGRSVTTTLKA